MAVRAQFESDEWGGQRYAGRRVLQLGALLAGSGEEVTIHNLSVRGFLIETSAVLAHGETLEILLPESGAAAASVVWQRGKFYGCEFAVPISPAVVSAAVLLSPPQHQPIRARVLAPDILEDAEEDDRYGLRTRVLVMVGLTTTLWILIGLLIAWLF